MDTEIVVIITVLSLIIVVCSINLIVTKKTEKQVFDSSSIFGLFDDSNINNIEFIRNKLVVSFKDATLFDVIKLKEFGGKGISVIGDKIKFFISDQPLENEKLYDDLKKQFER